MIPSRSFYGWKLVAVLFLLDFMNMGFPLYGGTVINTYMLRSLPMPRSTYGLGFTLLNLMVGIASPVAAAAIMKWGVRRTFVVGSGILFAGGLWLALVASQSWHYVVGFGVLMGTGISFGTLVPVTTAITRWFRRYRGRAMAISLGASGVAGFVLAPLINKLLAVNGGNWRQGWEIVAGLAIFSAILAVAAIKESPEVFGQVVDGGANDQTDEGYSAKAALTTRFAWAPAQAYATRAYWMIVIGGIASQFPFFFFTAHWILHLRGTGVTANDAAWAMALFSIAALEGRLVGGWLMDKLSARLAFMTGLCCYVIGSLLAIAAGPHLLSAAYAAAILYGTGFGWTFVCLNTSTAHFYGPAAFPKLNGFALLVSGIICAPAGVIGGKLFDLHGNYHQAFELNMLVALVGIVALTFATMPTPPTGGRELAQRVDAPASL